MLRFLFFEGWGNEWGYKPILSAVSANEFSSLIWLSNQFLGFHASMREPPPASRTSFLKPKLAHISYGRTSLPCLSRGHGVALEKSCLANWRRCKGSMLWLDSRSLIIFWSSLPGRRIKKGCRGSGTANNSVKPSKRHLAGTVTRWLSSNVCWTVPAKSWSLLLFFKSAKAIRGYHPFGPILPQSAPNCLNGQRHFLWFFE